MILKYIKTTVILLIWGLHCVNAQQVDTASASAQITLGYTATLTSTILKEERKLYIYLPYNDDDRQMRQEVYPVVYILDGREHFITTAAMIDKLSREMFLPKMIVVGIESTDRMRDFTPTAIHRLKDLPERYYQSSGGAGKFLRFLSDELIPYMEERYPVAQHRTIIGHSLAGLFVTYAMGRNSGLFKNYIAIEPSYWWDNNYLVQQQAAYKNCIFDPGTQLFLAAANTLPEDMAPDKVPLDKSKRTVHYRAITTYADLIHHQNCNEDHLKYKYYPEHSHANIATPAIYDALSTLFDFYNIDPVMRKFDPNSIYTINTEDFVQAFRDHYQNISRELGFPLLPEQDLITTMGYQSIELEAFDKAEALFRFNMTNFPESSGVYNAMGDFYMATARPYDARKYYLKAIALDNRPELRKKLNHLKTVAPEK